MSSLVAAATFHAPGRLVVEGESVDSADPVVKGREHLFAPAEDAAPAAPAKPRTARAKAKPAADA